MTEIALQIEEASLPGSRPSRPDRPAKARFLTAKDLDGRTRAAVRVRALTAAFLADLGVARASAAQQALAERGAVLLALIEDAETRMALGEPVDLGSHRAAIAELRRVLLALGSPGLDRRAVNKGRATTLLEEVST